MSLKYQLFLALLAGGAVLIALLAGIADVSFNRGFLDYVNRVDRKRFEPLREALVEGYEERGDWRWIENAPREWQRFVREHTLERGRQGRGLRRDGADAGRPSPTERGLLLADAQRRTVAGRGERAGLNWTPLLSDGVVVGYLADRPLQRIPTGLDAVFAARQRRSVLIASLCLLPISALLAWLLTSRIVRPLDRLNASVARMADGDFSERVPEQRRDELGELSRRVNRLASALQSNLGARQRWLAEISHELRTPVAVLQAELEALQDGITPTDTSALDSLHAETVHLSRLIDDLRDLTLADAGALDYRFERVDLARLLRERLEHAATRLADAGLELRFELPDALEVNADPQRIVQLFDNLLQNSLRYTDAGGHVHVELQRAGDVARLLWQDSAPGVPEPAYPHLFEPLYRVDGSRGRGRGGSGLGLAIVGKIAQAHGGRVHARASTLGGLAVELELPFNAIEPQGTGA